MPLVNDFAQGFASAFGGDLPTKKDKGKKDAAPTAADTTPTSGTPDTGMTDDEGRTYRRGGPVLKKGSTTRPQFCKGGKVISSRSF